jgi:hypothetical protein
VLNVSNILYRNCARSQNHEGQCSIFAFCSLRYADCTDKVEVRTVFHGTRD